MSDLLVVLCESCGGEVPCRCILGSGDTGFVATLIAERDEARQERDEAETLLLDVWAHNVSRGSVPLPADLFNRIADWARSVRERSG